MPMLDRLQFKCGAICDIRMYFERFFERFFECTPVCVCKGAVTHAAKGRKEGKIPKETIWMGSPFTRRRARISLNRKTVGKKMVKESIVTG